MDHRLSHISYRRNNRPKIQTLSSHFADLLFLQAKLLHIWDSFGQSYDWVLLCLTKEVNAMLWLKRIAFIVMIIGAINWGLIGFLGFDLVAFIFGGQAALLSRIIYAIVGIAGLFAITFLFTGREGYGGHAH